MWKFWKRREEKFITEVPLTTIARWYFYDAGIEEPNKMASVVGMLPVSKEGDEMEERASDERILRVAPLVPFIETMADINARAITALQFDHYASQGQVDVEQLTDEKEHIEDMYRQVGFSALLATFASALELGIISSETIKGDIIT